MKKLIIATVILLATTVQTFAGPIVTLRLEIGRKSQGCSKFGFCSWSVSFDLNTISNGSAQIIEKTNALQIILTEEAIAGKEEYFKGNTVTFEEEVIIPTNILKALEAKNKIVIQPGTYKLVKTQAGYQINIPLN